MIATKDQLVANMADGYSILREKHGMTAEACAEKVLRHLPDRARAKAGKAAGVS